jgi:hypothetical protein
MSWQDRLQEASYVPGGGLSAGRTLKFFYENVSRVTEKRTTAFSFPGINDNYIQDNGFGSRKYALRCYFWGDNCDKEADRFEEACLSDDVGELHHPLYGKINVVPFGTISRRDDLVTAANQSVVDVTFWTTTGLVYPSAERAPLNEVQKSILDYEEETPKWFEETMELKSAQQQAELRGEVLGKLALANAALNVPAQATEAVAREFRAWQQVINTGINVLVGNPALLAQQVFNMLRAPARAVIGIQSRLTGYIDFLQSVFTSPAGTPGSATGISARPSEQVRLANDWRTADLNALHALVSMAIAATETEYKTKPEALSVADALLAELDTVAAWREAGYAAFTSADLGSRIEVIDDGRAWLYASETIYRCAGYLVSLAFTLASERLTVLDRDRSIVDLAAEFYGKVDDETINFLIDSNDLCGCEILELKRGTEMLWYPQ